MNLLKELESPLPMPMTLYTDSKSTYDIVQKHGTSGRTKHFERWIHYCREQRLAGRIRIVLISTTMMIADLLTKAASKATFLSLRKKMVD